MRPAFSSLVFLCAPCFRALWPAGHEETTLGVLTETVCERCAAPTPPRDVHQVRRGAYDYALAQTKVAHDEVLRSARVEFPELGEFFGGLEQMRAALLGAFEIVGELAPSQRAAFRRGAAAIALALRRTADEMDAQLADLPELPS